MAEFCLDCLNKINETNYKRYQVKLFKGLDLCEECGKHKRCVCRLNALGELADLRQARKEYKKEFGKPYIPSKKKFKKIFLDKDVQPLQIDLYKNFCYNVIVKSE